MQDLEETCCSKGGFPVYAYIPAKTQDSNADKVTAAELTNHTVKHSFSYRSEDCGNKITLTMFPDSEIVKDKTLKKKSARCSPWCWKSITCVTMMDKTEKNITLFNISFCFLLTSFDLYFWFYLFYYFM